MLHQYEKRNRKPPFIFKEQMLTARRAEAGAITDLLCPPCSAAASLWRHELTLAYGREHVVERMGSWRWEVEFSVAEFRWQISEVEVKREL